MKWNGVLTIEEEETDDGRLCTGGSLTWRKPPLPLLWNVGGTNGPHSGGRAVGMIDEIWREGYVIKGRGRLFGKSLLRHMKTRHNRVGLGVDLMDVAVKESGMLVTFSEATIVSAWIEDNPAWPGCYLEGVH